MTIKGRVKLYWKIDCFHNEELKMKVVFSLPNKILPVKLKKTLYSTYLDKYLNYEDFLNNCMNFIEDKEMIKAMAKDLILKYIKKIQIKTMKNKIKQKIKEINQENIEVEVEIDE